MIFYLNHAKLCENLTLRDALARTYLCNFLLALLTKTKAFTDNFFIWKTNRNRTCLDYIRAYVSRCFPSGLADDDHCYFTDDFWLKPCTIVWKSITSRCLRMYASLYFPHDDQCLGWYLICGVSSKLLPNPNRTNLIHETIDQEVRIPFCPVGLAPHADQVSCLWHIWGSALKIRSFRQRFDGSESTYRVVSPWSCLRVPHGIVLRNLCKTYQNRTCLDYLSA